jgi:hypothetical protein
LEDNEIQITHCYVTIKVPKPLHKAIQHICVELDVNQQDYILELICDSIKDSYKTVLSEQRRRLENLDIE